MKKILFFVTSVNEAKYTREILSTLDSNFSKVVIISSNPSANLFFENNNTLYKDISIYFPNSKKVRVMFKKINDIIGAWYQKYNKGTGDNRDFQQIGFSLHNYLGDLEHSLATAKNIIDIERPDKLYVAKYWSETPFRRYQTENFNLYHAALMALCKNEGVKTYKLNVGFSQEFTTYLILFIIKIILSTVKVSIKQIVSRIKIQKLENLIIMANYYQLENLVPLLENLRDKSIAFSLIGNANLGEIRTLSKKNLSLYPISSLELITLKFSKIRLFKIINYFFKWIKYKKRLKHFFNRFDKNYWDLISAKFLYYFLYDFPLISGLITNARNVFDNKKMLLTMATTDTISHSISYAAKLSRMNVLELQHGMLFMDIDRIHRLNDYYILWGKRARDIITNRKSNLNKYPIGGFPLFDKYNKNHFSQLRPAIRKSFGIHTKTKTILIMAVFPTGLARINQKISPFQYIDMIFQTVSHLSGKWKVIFRPHPSFGADWIKIMAKQRNIDFYYDDRKLAVEKSIAASDIVIANPTTPILDAMFLKKPVLTFLFHYDLDNEISNSFLVKSRATVLFNNQDELRKYVGLCINNLRFQKRMLLGQEKFLREYCMAFSGSSTVRVSKTILDILKV